MEKTLLKQIAASVCVLLALAGCAGQSQQPDGPALSDFGPAPELNNDTWFNTIQPLRLEDLRGKVVLLEMWTFG